MDLLKGSDLHGRWFSKTDDTAVYIWADSNDSGLDSFYVDSFFVKGCNIPAVKIVVTDDLESPWQEVGEVSLEKYRVRNISTVIDNDKTSLIYQSEMYLFQGILSDKTCYIYSSGEAACKVVNNDRQEIQVARPQSLTSLNDSDKIIYSSDGSAHLSEPIRARYVGFKLDPFDTYEGRFYLSKLDFGKSNQTPLKENFNKGSGVSINFETSTSFVSNGQGFSNQSSKSNRSYNFQFDLIDSSSFVQFMSGLDKSSINGKPIWVVNNYIYDTFNFDHCFVGSVSTSLVKDVAGDIHYVLTLPMNVLGD